MERVPVVSTTITSLGYDKEGHVLEVEFPGGAIYQYMNVPEEIFQAFLAAESKGRYFNLVFRPMGFEYVKL